MFEQGLKVLMECNLLLGLKMPIKKKSYVFLYSRNSKKKWSLKMEKKIKCLKTNNGGEYVYENSYCGTPNLSGTKSLAHVSTDSRRRGDHGVVESATNDV
ncbi:hypothetical protein CR513_56671, partial [Mucuna pruriens]